MDGDIITEADPEKNVTDFYLFVKKDGAHHGWVPKIFCMLDTFKHA